MEGSVSLEVGFDLLDFSFARRLWWNGKLAMCVCVCVYGCAFVGEKIIRNEELG